MHFSSKHIVTALFCAVAGTAGAQDASFPDIAGEFSILNEAREMQCGTHDGYGVSVMNMSAAGLYENFSVRFGNADYVEDFGYRTFIDVASLEGASRELQLFIAAHECAHHLLGHTYEAYDMGFIPQDRHHAYERQADCEAIRVLALDYGISGRDRISAIFDELADVNQEIILSLPIDAEIMAPMLNDLPARSEARKADGMRCAFY